MANACSAEGPKTGQEDGTIYWRTPLNKGQLRSFRGEVHILADRCKECSFCVKFCPQEVLEISARYTPKGYRPVQVKPGKKDDCIACRFCQDVCPEFAIFVEEVGK